MDEAQPTPEIVDMVEESRKQGDRNPRPWVDLTDSSAFLAFMSLPPEEQVKVYVEEHGELPE